MAQQVNIAELSLPQLEVLKTQLDQEVEFLSSSIAQLKVVQTKYVEAKDCLNVLNKSNEGEVSEPCRSSILSIDKQCFSTRNCSTLKPSTTSTKETISREEEEKASKMYVPGKLSDVSHVLLDVGTGYYVEKRVDEARDFFKRKIDFLTKQIEKIQPALQEKHAMKQAVIEMMNQKIQQLTAAGASQVLPTKA